ncbi:MAG: DUF4349 domain-containing protein [Nanoarchaeota archaeon]
MAIKEQLIKIKENWLLLVLVLILTIFISNGPGLIQTGTNGFYKNTVAPSVYMDEEIGYAPGTDTAGRGYSSSGNFAPEIESRVITKDTRLAAEIKRGTFQDAESKIKSIIESSGSYLLNEDVNNYGTKRESYYYGNYQIKVDVNKYDEVISQLKKIGEVVSFNENQRDITKEYVDIKIEIEAEKARLTRYQEMYEEAKEVSDKIELNDRIFNQERTIKYMENSLENLNQRVDYSTIYFSMTEKQSDYINVVFIKFSELVRSFVNSFNSLISLVFVLVPWAVAGSMIMFIVKLAKKRK